MNKMTCSPQATQTYYLSNGKTVKVGGGYNVFIDGNPVPRDENIARLIAAAPELLEALENAVARMQENIPQKPKRGDLDGTFRVATFHRDMQEALRAIRKAKGE